MKETVTGHAAACLVQTAALQLRTPIQQLHQISLVPLSWGRMGLPQPCSPSQAQRLDRLDWVREA